MSQYLLGQRVIGDAVADVRGKAIARVSNDRGPSWEIKQISIIAVTPTSVIPSASTFIGQDESGVFISTTGIGNADTDSFPQTVLRYGETLCCVWTTAQPGSVFRMVATYNEVEY